MFVYVLVVLSAFSLITTAFCQNLHPIESKPGLCFKIHTQDQPILRPNPRKVLYPDLYESCTEWLKENENCLGLKTQNGETIVVYCRGVSKRNRPGCYKIINKDKKEEIICQKVNRVERCEVIATRTNLSVVVYCNSGSLTTIDVKTQKPKRE